MPQQLNFLAEAAVRPPAVVSQREKHAALKDRAPPSRSASSTQESLFAFQAVGHELLILPNKEVAPSPPPKHPPSSPTAVESAADNQHVGITAHGDKAKARDILAAIRTLKAIEEGQRPATPDERQTLAGFPGFGVVALGIFPDPVTGRYKDSGWQKLGGALQTLLTPDEYASAKRTTFTAFYPAPLVIRAMYDALRRFGVPPDATVLEPGCGIGNFMGLAPEGMRFIGVELDSISGRIARALYPGPPGANTDNFTFSSNACIINMLER